MGVTIRQIAEAAGVSRGTVDRALNNRGRIRPEVAERVRQIAEEMGYKPNQLGRALSMSRNNIKIGVILQGAETPFMKEVMKGVEEARAEVDNLGGTVLIHTIEHQSAEDVLFAMEKMRQEEVSGIAMVPLEAEEVKKEIDRFVEEHPDFSYRGAKGIVALTGYNGILGYRTDSSYETRPDDLDADKVKWLDEHPDFDLNTERENAARVAQAMKDEGWLFASHTWGHIRIGDASMERIQTDTQKWLEYVAPLVGGTDTIIFAHGQESSFLRLGQILQELKIIQGRSLNILRVRDTTITAMWIPVSILYRYEVITSDREEEIWTDTECIIILNC